jgi:7,8-dihydroneopterin aldolase/epimerase/oxygenase
VDVIRLKNMTFYGYHGVSAAEKETGRRYEVDCDLSLDLTVPAKSDRLADTVNYAEVYRIVEEVLNGKRYSLLEAIAAEIAQRVLLLDHIQKVAVRVRKMIPPIPGNLDHIEVEISRTRE